MSRPEASPASCSDAPEVDIAGQRARAAGEARLRSVLTEAGFRQVRRAAETPFNLVLEARP